MPNPMAHPDGPGSQATPEAPVPASSPVGADPLRVQRLSGWLTASGKRNLMALPRDGWATVSEMKPAATGSGMDLLFVRTHRGDELCERRWTRWGSEGGQKRGEGYEYRITPLGSAVRAAIAQHVSEAPNGD